MSVYGRVSHNLHWIHNVEKNRQLALSLLDRIDQLIDVAKSRAERLGGIQDWQRDKNFIACTRLMLVSGDTEEIRSILDEMRNLSQGFGGYCDDLHELDALTTKLYEGVVQVFMDLRTGRNPESI
jgi:uncharacterized protein CbrC (UPF0167 family)